MTQKFPILAREGWPHILIVLAAAVLVHSFAGGWWALPLWLLLAGGGLLLVAIFAAWAKFGRATLPFTSLLATPFYVLWKVPIYVAYFVRRQQAWVRTERDRPAVPPPAEQIPAPPEKTV